MQKILVLGRREIGKTTWINSVSGSNFEFIESQMIPEDIASFGGVLLMVDLKDKRTDVEDILDSLRGYGIKTIVILARIDILSDSLISYVTKSIEDTMGVVCIPISSLTGVNVEVPLMQFEEV